VGSTPARNVVVAAFGESHNESDNGRPRAIYAMPVRGSGYRFGSRAHRVNRDLAVVQDLLGHASPATTCIYVATDDTDRRRTSEAIAS